MGASAIVVAALAVSTAVSIDQQNKAAADLENRQDEQQATELAIGNKQAARERRSQVQKSLVAQSELENTAAASGLTTSSAAISGGDAVQSQAATNIGDINTSLATGGVLSEAKQRTANAGRTSTLGQVAGAVSSNLMSGAASAGGAAAGKSLFKSTS
jgi:hypothetical protein